MNGAEFDLLPCSPRACSACALAARICGTLLMLALAGTAIGIIGFGQLHDVTGSMASRWRSGWRRCCWRPWRSSPWAIPASMPNENQARRAGLIRVLRSYGSEAEGESCVPELGRRRQVVDRTGATQVEAGRRRSLNTVPLTPRVSRSVVLHPAVREIQPWTSS